MNHYVVHLKLILQISYTLIFKEQKMWLICMDLNHNKVNQNHLCYHYTTGLLQAILSIATWYLIYHHFSKSQDFFCRKSRLFAKKSLFFLFPYRKVIKFTVTGVYQHSAADDKKHTAVDHCNQNPRYRIRDHQTFHARL